MTTTTRTVPRIYYEGTAAEDLAEDQLALAVIVPELVPNTATGTLGAGIQKSTTSLMDRDGNKTISSTATSANHIVATWEGSSNSREPPMVRKGEPVEVYQIANQDKYYWRTTGRGRDFRTTDRVVFEVAAMDPTKPGGKKDDSNTWSGYMDSEKKKFGLRTSMANGEVTAMKIEGDMAEGTFFLSDSTEDPGNRVFVDTGAKSGTPMFHVNLSSGVTFRMEKDNVYFTVPKQMIIKTSDRLIFDSPLTIFNTGKVGTVIINAASITLSAAGSIILSGAVAGINAASTKISGVLVAASARVMNLVKGAAGSNYTEASVDRPTETPARVPNNSADTSMSGPPYIT